MKSHDRFTQERGSLSASNKEEEEHAETGSISSQAFSIPEAEEQGISSTLKQKSDSSEEGQRINMLKRILEGILGPLASIINLNEAISANRFGQANFNIKSASRLATENGKNLVKILEEIIASTNEGKGTSNGFRPTVNLHELGSSTFQLIKASELHAGTKMSFKYELDNHLLIQTDQKKFIYVFTKLVNASRHLSPKADIEVSFRYSPCGAQVCLQVNSTPGKGVSLLDRKSFLGLRQNSSSQLKKFGFVSDLVKKYAEELGGELKLLGINNQYLGLEFSFPIAGAEKKAPACGVANSLTGERRKSQGTVHPYNGSDPQVFAPEGKQGVALVLGQSEENLREIDSLIGDSHLMLFARSFRELVGMLEKYGEKVDFLICSWCLFCVDDKEAFEEIKIHERWKSIPLIFVTDEVRASQRFLSAKIGFEGYLIFPFQLTELEKVITASIECTKNRNEWSVDSAKQKNLDGRISDFDLDWLIELEKIILKEMANRYFNLAELAYQMATSERQLFRKVKELTGKTPNQYVRDLKIYAARKLLMAYSYRTVAEISYAVGFQDPHYFSKIFKTTFGKWPSDFLKKSQMEEN